MTETTTEYKEVTDDSDFAGFDTSAFPGLQSTNPNFEQLKVSENASSDSSSDSDDENEDKFQEEALKSHNDYRQKHGVPPLKLDKKVRFLSLEGGSLVNRDS